jgi:glutathione S-transferase
VHTDTPTLTLYDWRPSPFCMKVRAVLRHKGLAYTKKSAIQHIRQTRQRGGFGKVPLLEIGDDVIADSTDIVHELERRFPEPSVLPSTPRERALCHALEDWADESLYFLGLYYHWCEPRGRARVAAYFRKTWMGWLAFPPFLARIERQVRGQGTGRKPPVRVRADLERHLVSIEEMLRERPFLLGETPHLCDYALASQLGYLTLAPETETMLAPHPSTARFLAVMRERTGGEIIGR